MSRVHVYAPSLRVALTFNQLCAAAALSTVDFLTVVMLCRALDWGVSDRGDALGLAAQGRGVGAGARVRCGECDPLDFSDQPDALAKTCARGRVMPSAMRRGSVLLSGSACTVKDIPVYMILFQ